MSSRLQILIELGVVLIVLTAACALWWLRSDTVTTHVAVPPDAPPLLAALIAAAHYPIFQPSMWVEIITPASANNNALVILEPPRSATKGHPYWRIEVEFPRDRRGCAIVRATSAGEIAGPLAWLKNRSGMGDAVAAAARAWAKANGGKVTELFVQTRKPQYGYEIYFDGYSKSPNSKATVQVAKDLTVLSVTPGSNPRYWGDF